MFAGGRRRTLLIDADIRRGVQHRRCAGQRRPGLAEYLRGAVPLDQILQRTQYGFDLIACGLRAREAPELLDGPGMPRLLALLRPNYDVIVCDLTMPYMTGEQLYREIEKRFGGGVADRIVFVTGGALSDEGGAFLQGVPNARLFKPFDPLTLSQQISEALGWKD